jgi:hypothetical protein
MYTHTYTHRSLIIFGQGLTRSHPHLLHLIKAIQVRTRAHTHTHTYTHTMYRKSSADIRCIFL